MSSISGELRICTGMISRSKSTERLYELEENAREAIKEAAYELLRVMGLPSSEIWTAGVPTELYTMLEGYAAGLDVAKKYVEVQMAKGRS